jgi:cysteine desulfurase/selenocysteine lyase
MNARLGDRSGFDAVQARVYFNHASMSPPSRAVREAVLEAIDSYAAHGAGAWMHWSERRAQLRARLASLVGAAHADEIALVPNTSYGVIDIATAINWRPGDRIITWSGEFPTNVTPWQRAADRFDAEVVFLPPPRVPAGNDTVDLEPLATALRRGARLVAVSAVQFQTGLRMPLEAIGALCRSHGALFFVDGIQAIGAVPVDVEAARIDFLACGGHKWLMGIEGTGFLYARTERIAELRPLVAGWLSHEEGAAFLFGERNELRYDRPMRGSAQVFDVGVASSSGFAALDAATEPLAALGPAAIHAHAQPILDDLEEGLCAEGFRSVRAAAPHARSCILSVVPPSDLDLAACARGLADRGIAAATPDGHLRFSPHWPNDRVQAREALGALREWISTARA